MTNLSKTKSGKSPTRQAVLAMSRSGMGVREIASALGLSTQAVHKHLKRLRDAGALPPKEGAA
jgi:predicted ArsR family transcriptional regulator